MNKINDILDNLYKKMLMHQERKRLEMTKSEYAEYKRSQLKEISK